MLDIKDNWTKVVEFFKDGIGNFVLHVDIDNVDNLNIKDASDIPFILVDPDGRIAKFLKYHIYHHSSGAYVIELPNGDLANNIRKVKNIKDKSTTLLFAIPQETFLAIKEFCDNLIEVFKTGVDMDYRDANTIQVNYYSPYYSVRFDGKKINTNYLSDKLKKYLLNYDFLKKYFEVVKDNTLDREYGVDLTFEFSKEEFELAVAGREKEKIKKIQDMTLEDLFVSKYVKKEVFDDDDDFYYFDRLTDNAPDIVKKKSKMAYGKYYIYDPDVVDFKMFEDELEQHRQELIDKVLKLD